VKWPRQQLRPCVFSSASSATTSTPARQNLTGIGLGLAHPPAQRLRVHPRPTRDPDHSVPQSPALGFAGGLFGGPLAARAIDLCVRTGWRREAIPLASGRFITALIPSGRILRADAASVLRGEDILSDQTRALALERRQLNQQEYSGIGSVLQRVRRQLECFVIECRLPIDELFDLCFRRKRFRYSNGLRLEQFFHPCALSLFAQPGQSDGVTDHLCTFGIVEIL
jgi:hypothetical protein